MKIVQHVYVMRQQIHTNDKNKTKRFMTRTDEFKPLFQANLVAESELEDTVFNLIAFENMRQAQVVATIEDSTTKIQAKAHRNG